LPGKRVRKAPFKACRNCHMLVPPEATRCPNCGSTDLTEDWKGVIIVIDPESSTLAKKLKIERPGRYAVLVS